MAQKSCLVFAAVHILRKMATISDRELVERFAKGGSEEAFRELVTRHIGLVYSVALRHTGNPHHAEEISQAVFVLLVRRAKSLGKNVVVSGWLYHTARLTAANFQRAEFRRIRREKEVYMQSPTKDEIADEVWRDLLPLLDRAMASLSAADRDCMVLRFFENKSFRDVASTLGIEEGAAQRRVSRSLERLRAFFRGQGLDLSASAIAGAVSANSIAATPVGLGASVAARSLSPGNLGSSVPALIRQTGKKLLWPVTAFVGAVAWLGLTIGCGALFWQAPQKPPQGLGIHSVFWFTNLVVPPPSVNPVVHIKMTGPAGMPFEVSHSENGNEQVTPGVLPGEVSFPADAFSARITVQGSGEVGFEIYRDDFRLGAISGARVTNGRTWLVEAKNGARGFSIKRLTN
jgi:RNA polymerase sigma factor (sigma-70 family)